MLTYLKIIQYYLKSGSNEESPVMFMTTGSVSADKMSSITKSICQNFSSTFFVWLIKFFYIAGVTWSIPCCNNTFTSDNLYVVLFILMWFFTETMPTQWS